MCFDHGVSMDDGDHSECTIELLDCPLHHAPTEPSSPHVNEPPIEKDWAPIKVPENLEEMVDAWANDPEPNVGWCLLCNSPIRTEDDLIPETNTHNCEVGREMEAKIAALPPCSQGSEPDPAAGVEQTGGRHGQDLEGDRDGASPRTSGKSEGTHET
jgi:hypothetical protein